MTVLPRAKTETVACDHTLKIVIVWWMFAESRSASSSLEELSIRISEDVVFGSIGNILGNYTNLSLVTIEHVTSVRCRPLTTEVIVVRK